MNFFKNANIAMSAINPIAASEIFITSLGCRCGTSGIRMQARPDKLPTL